MKRARNILLFLAAVALVGCATMPTGPSVMVLPAAGKPFEVFQSEDFVCRDWAAAQIGQQPADAVNQNLVGGAAVGTLLGAGLGAAIGAASGNVGAGAAIGAASGLFGGTAMASGPAYSAGYEAQRRYDIAYQQCMYSKGNAVPWARPARRYYSVPPPPPPGSTTAGPYAPPPSPGSTTAGPYAPPPPRPPEG
jgi:hypothetical protein